MYRYLLSIGLTVVAAGAVAQTAPAPAPAPLTMAQRNAMITAPLPPAEAAMKAHVMFLASDAMKGRDAGSPEYDIAAEYVASQFYVAGLAPAGTDGSFLQTVPLLSYHAKDEGAMTLTGAGGTKIALKFGADYIPGANPEAALTNVDAPIIFVGQGIVAPHRNRDDYAGVDVKGKIVAFIDGSPESFDGEERAHFGGSANKAALASARGAVGVIVLQNGQSRSFGWLAGNYKSARMTWVRPDGTGHLIARGTPTLGILSVRAAARLFGGEKAYGAVVAKATGPRGTRAMALPYTLSATLNTEMKKVMSANVAGLLVGSDPKLKDEYVVLTAHLDHVGVGRPVDGDAIYNGAMDNAVGIAALIEEARKFKASGKPPRRSILFLAVTAEEKGLIGSDYFAYNPTVPRAGIVANVNLDMPVITYKFEDMVVFGADRSTLGPIVRRAVEGIGLKMAPDPMPSEGLFVRSDHYRFIQQGVPSVFLWPGLGGPGKAAFEEFFQNHYHQPSDDMSRPFDWASGVRFIAVNYAIAREIADGDARPAWNKGDFFGTLYNGYGAK